MCIKKEYFDSIIFFCVVISGPDREASIQSASESSIYDGLSAEYLLDGKGLNGNMEEFRCAHTERETGTVQWFSLELAVPQNISRIQITPRLDCCPKRVRDISITIGPSKSYDPNEPLCLPKITQLVLEEGLTNYWCTGTVHEGKYVKISRDHSMILCEVKVFTWCLIEEDINYGGSDINDGSVDRDPEINDAGTEAG